LFIQIVTTYNCCAIFRKPCLTFLKKPKKNQETIEDEFFGKLSFVEATEYEASYLFGAKEFPPLNHVVEYQIYDVSKTVTQEQRKWITKIENKYDGLKVEIETFINSELVKIDGKGKKISIEKDLTIDLITIPKNLNEVVEWSITYKLGNDFAFFTVEFRDLKPYWFSVSA
jgi:hypothetical protein